jgi:hypothetical protein
MKNPKILDLRPTQFVLGMKEIDSKLSEMKGFSPKKMAAYHKDHVIPVVLGPSSQTFLIDHHHYLRACWELGINDYILEVIKDLSKQGEHEFWNFMIKKDWCYLHDQFGMGPHPPSLLPMDIRCLADDPYRSLAWALREEKYIQKKEIPFFEFRWAAFFRQNLTIRLRSKSDFKEAIAEAKELARSKAASHLPGYSAR